MNSILILIMHCVYNVIICTDIDRCSTLITQIVLVVFFLFEFTAHDNEKRVEFQNES